MNNELICVENVLLGCLAKTKDEVLKAIAKHAFEIGVVNDEVDYYNGLVNREAEVTTGFGGGIAIPHARTKSVIKPALLAVCLEGEVDWQALDDKPVKMALAIAMPDQGDKNAHLSLLSSLARKLMHEEFAVSLLNSNSEVEIVEILKGEN